MRVTLKDIAKKANVNFTLVSKYINKTPGVSIRAETRQRIEDAIRELNHRPIAAARALRSGKSNTLGLAVYNLTNEYFAHYADAAIRETEKCGYKLLISVSRDKSLESAVASLDSNQVDGIICQFTPSPINGGFVMTSPRSSSTSVMRSGLQSIRGTVAPKA